MSRNFSGKEVISLHKPATLHVNGYKNDSDCDFLVWILGFLIIARGLARYEMDFWLQF